MTGDEAVQMNQFHGSQLTSEWHGDSSKLVTPCRKTYRGEIQFVQTVCEMKNTININELSQFLNCKISFFPVSVKVVFFIDITKQRF